MTEDLGASDKSDRAAGLRPQPQAASRSSIPSAALSHETFCARFKARMLAVAGPVFDDGGSIAEYADEAGPAYFEQEDWLTREGPEECADADMSYWGE